jgi:plastin-1
MSFSLVNVGGVDIVDGNKKLILSFVWQLMRYHTIKILTSLSGDGSKISDSDIVEWANTRVSQAGFASSMRDFKDRSLGDSVFLLDLLTAMRPQSVNREICTEGSNAEDAKNNARYAISVARKIGASSQFTNSIYSRVNAVFNYRC